MVKPQDNKSALGAWLAEIASAIVRLLDPHLRSGTHAENTSREEHWSLRKMLLYVVGVSLALWGVAYWAFRRLFKR
jgi:hypothetical protein